MANLKLLLLPFIFCSGTLLGQTNDFSLTTMVPLSGVYYPEQVMDQLLVTNSTSNVGNCYLVIEVTTSYGAEVVTATTPAFEVSLGTSVLGLSMDIGYDITYGSNVSSQALQYTGFLPVGEYVVCYTLYDNTQLSMLSNTCDEFVVEGVVGPIATTPLNGDTIYSCVPYFTWIPLFPESPGITYQFTLCEVLTDQSPTEALLTNMPLVSVPGVINKALSLSGNYGVLADSLTYVWQVSAIANQNQIVGQSDPETFVPICAITLDTAAIGVLDFNGYTEPKYTSDDSYIIVKETDSLNILFNNPGNMTFLVYDVIYSDSSDQVQVMDYTLLPVVALKTGYNLIDLPVSVLSSVLVDEKYFFIKIKSDIGDMRLKYLYLQEE